MHKIAKNPYYHISYWVLVVLVLTLIFGLSWGSNTAAFFFVCMLLPIVLGTSYFFNYVLVPKYYLKKKYTKFAFYTFCMAVISIYLEMLVLVISYVYLVNLSYRELSPNATDIVLLAVLLMVNQIKENRRVIQQLLEDKKRMKKSFLEIISNRKITKIPYEDIVYIESLSDYIKVITLTDQIVSKEKISNLSARLPEIFLRIHRSFIINTEKIKSISYDEVVVEGLPLTIGRSYRKAVKESLGNNK
jgi:hypothetical protein